MECRARRQVWPATATSACTACSARGRRNRPSDAQVRPRDPRTGRRPAAEQWSGDADDLAWLPVVATGMRHTAVARRCGRLRWMRCCSHGGLLHEGPQRDVSAHNPRCGGIARRQVAYPLPGFRSSEDKMRLTYTGDGTQECCSGPSANRRCARPPGPQDSDRPAASAARRRRSRHRSRPALAGRGREHRNPTPCHGLPVRGLRRPFGRGTAGHRAPMYRTACSDLAEPDRPHGGG